MAEGTGTAGRRGPRLTGSTCPSCGVVSYPVNAFCALCGTPMEEGPLSREGELWTWTVQRFAPKSPPYTPPSEPFEPFAVGYVELPEGVRVAAIIETDELADLRISLPVELVEHGGVPRFAVLTSEQSTP